MQQCRRAQLQKLENAKQMQVTRSTRTTIVQNSTRHHSTTMLEKMQQWLQERLLFVLVDDFGDHYSFEVPMLTTIALNLSVITNN
jgi:hypothetical protein